MSCFRRTMGVNEWMRWAIHVTRADTNQVLHAEIRYCRIYYAVPSNGFSNTMRDYLRLFESPKAEGTCCLFRMMHKNLYYSRKARLPLEKSGEKNCQPHFSYV